MRYKITNWHDPKRYYVDDNDLTITYGDLTDTKHGGTYTYGAIEAKLIYDGQRRNKIFKGETAHHDCARWLQDQTGWPCPFIDALAELV